MARIPVSYHVFSQEYYQESNKNNTETFSRPSFNANTPLLIPKRHVTQKNQITSMPSTSLGSMQPGLMNSNRCWLPQQSPHMKNVSFSRPSGQLPNTVRHFPPNVSNSNVMFVRPLGPQKTKDNDLSTSKSCNNDMHTTMQYNSKPVRFTSTIRGLSPQKPSRTKTYPSYVIRHPLKLEDNQSRVQMQNEDKSNPASRQVLSSHGIKNDAEQIVQRIKRNLNEISYSQNNSTIFSGTNAILQRGRMGWSLAKRTKFDEEKTVPPQVLVISSDEEDEVEVRPVEGSAARISFLQTKKSEPEITATARNIAELLPVSSAGSGQSNINAVKNLNYGLSVLDEPKRILDALEEVLRERPKRLRISLKSLYCHSKAGCLSKVLPLLLEDMNPASPVNLEDGKTALHAAASKGHLDVLIVLTYKAAGNIDVRDKFKRTPFYVAVEKGHLTAAQFLHKAGASLKTKNFEGMGLIHVAVQKLQFRVLKWLLTLEVSINDQDNGGWSPLMWAAEVGKFEVFKTLLHNGASVQMRDKELNTCLHWAAMAGELEGCEALLALHADINAVNKYGDTPLHIAAREGNHDVVKLFLIRGVDTSVRNNNNKLPMEVCVNNQQIRDTIRLRHAIGHVGMKYQYDCDMSKGKERIPVSCINEVDDEPLPLDFTYISDIVESCSVSIMKDLLTIKGCKCESDCQKGFCECIQRNEKSKCWYDNNILDARFFDLDQPVLVECSKLCRCWSTCGNRIVQKGLQFPLEVFKTANIGWGLRSIVEIPKGSFVLSYVGEAISDEEAERRSDDSYLFDLDMKNSKDEANCLDANFFGNCGRFINHSCDANLMPVRVFTHHRDWRYPGIAFFTCRDIEAYTELSFDYGDKFWEIKMKNGLRCQCKSAECKYG